MELQNLSRWQWALIGLLLGLAMSFAYSRWDTSDSLVAVAPAQFERDLLRTERRAEGDPPAIRNVTLYPPVVGPSYVTFEQIDLQRQAYVKHVIRDRQPWRVTEANGAELGGEKTAESLGVYLEKVRLANPGFNYTYAWWNEKTFIYLLWTGGAVLIVGGVWPTLVNLMIGAGFAPPRKPKEKRIKQSASKPEPAAPVRPQVDEAEIAAVAAAYEQQLAAGGDASDAGGAGEDHPDQAAIRKLDGGPVEPVAIPHRPEDDEPKEFVGEFYPVVKTHHKKE